MQRFASVGRGKIKSWAPCWGRTHPRSLNLKLPLSSFSKTLPSHCPHTQPPPPLFFSSLPSIVMLFFAFAAASSPLIVSPAPLPAPNPTLFFFTLEKSNEHHTCTPHAPLHRTNGEAHRDLPPASPQFYPSDRRVPRYSRTGIAARGPLTRSFALWRVSGTRAGPTSLTS